MHYCSVLDGGTRFVWNLRGRVIKAVRPLPGENGRSNVEANWVVRCVGDQDC